MAAVLDHVVILSGPLEREIERYAALGFVVERGGSHPRWGTENALIVFGDGAYLELLAVREGAQTSHRLWRRPDGTPRRPGAYSAFALGVDRLAAAASRLRGAGVTFSDLQEGSRVRPDGRRLEWRTAFPVRADLPFLIEDVTRRVDRVPPPPSGSLNAGTSLLRVSTVTSELRGVLAAYKALALSDPSTQSNTVTVRTGGAEIAVRPAGGAHEEAGLEAITLRFSPAVLRRLPVTPLRGVPHLDRDAVGGLRIAVTT